MKLTERQADAYRQLVREGIEDGLSEREAHTEAVALMYEDVLPNWPRWLQPPTQVEQMLGVVFKMVQVVAVLRLLTERPEILTGPLRQMGEVLALVTGENGSDPHEAGR